MIGTEVPVPGGATEDLDTLAITTPDAARATIDVHRAIFAEAGLADAWPRVIAAVVQPGVEFDHRKVVDYAPGKARALSRDDRGMRRAWSSRPIRPTTRRRPRSRRWCGTISRS